MKKFLFLFFFTYPILFTFSEDIIQSYVQVYGEGPIGQYMQGFNSETYSEKQAVELARAEIEEFLSGMVYGYNFIYFIENKINNTKGSFELTPIAKLKSKDKNLSLYQSQENQESIKIKALYRLNDNQKDYIRSFQSSLAKISSGESLGSTFDPWPKRLDIFKDAIRNAILNDARDRYKSRPLSLKGKILLAESPKFTIKSGEWCSYVKIHVIITKVEYRDVY